MLDSRGTESVTGSFGYLSSVYKVVDSTDGYCYALRRVERVRTNNEIVVRVCVWCECEMMTVQRWAKLLHPAIISLHDCFLSNGAVFFVHEYYPSAISLSNRYLSVSERVWCEGQNAVSSPPLNEDILWCVAIQLLSGLQAIHGYDLSCRVIDCRHVLETERNRYRIGSVGVMDVLEPRSNQRELQMQDCRQVGEVLVALGSRGSALCELKTVRVRYSDRLSHVVEVLLSGDRSASAVLAECTPELVKTLNSTLSTADTYYRYLVRVVVCGEG